MPNDELEDMYKSQIEEIVKTEANRILEEKLDPLEVSRLGALSLISLFESDDPSLIPALMARLGTVRAALEGHGGSLVLTRGKIETRNNGTHALSLVIGLDGACISCGAAPGTLKGIQDDLLSDDEVDSIRFDSSMLEWFDEVQREFILKFGGVTFA
tara:strand:+ start:2548 stop:3018 length:471 start_codon:yes stop_codon:yes gene_type:complete